MAKRKPKFDKFLQDAFLDLIRQGIGITNACAKVGIARSTLKRFRDKNEHFSEAIHEAEMDANELVEMALFRTAIGGNVTAQQVWLYNRDPERWQDRRNVTVGGDKDNPIRVEWEETRFAIVAAVDDDPVAKQKIIDALEQRRRPAVCPESGDLG